MDATNRYSKTIEYYDRALALDPQQPEARQFRALALLARGQFGEGWREYVWRFRYSASFSGRFPIPHWRGEPLAGQKILVWTEQGLGDEVLIASMIPDLLCRGARIVLVASARLCELFARSFPTVDIIPAEELHAAEAIADVAYQASMSDLGQHLRPSFDAFPSTRSYLAADAGLARSLRETYQSKNEGNLLVGISWRSQARDGGAQKTVALRQWEPLLISPGFTFVNLQYGDTTAEVAETERVLGIRILTDPTVGALGSLDPFASQVAALDHVITVSNTTAHMAGALGKETSVLIPSNAGRLWYWFLERADSPWYPSLRLFRQRGADWKGVMRQVAEVLISRRSSQELKG